jgi:hypothetical protein
LKSNHIETYLEVTNIYADIMESVYYGHLKQYFHDTAKLIQKAAKSQEFLFTDSVNSGVGVRTENAVMTT